jgi:hypothetical protein
MGLRRGSAQRASGAARASFTSNGKERFFQIFTEVDSGAEAGAKPIDTLSRCEAKLGRFFEIRGNGHVSRIERRLQCRLFAAGCRQFFSLKLVHQQKKPRSPDNG